MSSNGTMAALAIGAGISLVIYLLQMLSIQDERHLYPEPGRRSPSPSFSGSPQPRRRAILPPPRTPRTSAPRISSAEERRRSWNPRNCFICKCVMQNSTITLNCGHRFHDQCITVWRYMMVSLDAEHAPLCPTCE